MALYISQKAAPDLKAAFLHPVLFPRSGWYITVFILNRHVGHPNDKYGSFGKVLF
jgi:hypothetical protein